MKVLVLVDPQKIQLQEQQRKQVGIQYLFNKDKSNQVKSIDSCVGQTYMNICIYISYVNDLGNPVSSN